MAEEEVSVNKTENASMIVDEDSVIKAQNITKDVFIGFMLLFIVIGIVANILYIMEYTMRLRRCKRLFNYLMMYVAGNDLAYLISYGGYLIGKLKLIIICMK